MKKIIFLIVLTTTFSAIASDVTLPNVFVANQPAVASEVNGNFGAVKIAVDDNNTRLAALELLVTQLQNDLADANNTINSLNSRLVAVEDNSVLDLDGLLVYSEFYGYPTAEFRAVNVQVNSGAPYTDSPVNGLGNIIIGYNEVDGGRLFCSNGEYTDSVNCIGNGFIWDRDVHRGSHNLILGIGNSYDNYSSIINGIGNVVNGDYSVVLSGINNMASNEYATVTTGLGNIANGLYSSVSGGFENTSNGAYSSISGGRNSEASGHSSSINGGYLGLASGSNSSINGGWNNQATGVSSSISGGRDNLASGYSSNVSGGESGIASGDLDWVAGTLFEDL